MFHCFLNTCFWKLEFPKYGDCEKENNKKKRNVLQLTTILRIKVYLNYPASSLLLVTFTFLKLISPLEPLHIYSLLQKDTANKTFFLLS